MLSPLWFRYNPAQRREIATQILKCEAEFIRARFTSIGSIYHNPEDDTFYVGPMGPAVCRPLNHTVDRGPWKSTSDWFKAYIKSELAGIRSDPEAYRKTRRRYCSGEGDPPLAYHVAWLETLLTTIDRLQYLKNLPASVERPVLYHEDFSGGNILVYPERPTTLAGIIDFEGASVIPLWSAMVPPAFLVILDEAERQSLMDLRDQILCEADPACAEAKVVRQNLRLLLWLVRIGITIWCSMKEFQETYRDMKEAWPEHEPAFAELDELVALGPAGYIERGNV
jgi:hypothetical protein